jgi:predicted Zn-dependent peptidase
MKRMMRVATMLLIAVCAAAQNATASAKELTIPVVYYRLPNGLRVVISEEHLAPVASVAVYYGVGFRVEPKGRTGFAHLFEHMMFQGSANVKKLEHAKYVEANGGTLNGSTRLDYTQYYETLPSNAVETALWLEADRMHSLALTEENLANQKQVVSEEVRNAVLDQPYGLFEWLDLWQNANHNWNNAHNFYGDLHDLDAATLDEVRDFFKHYYAPNNAVLAVTGDVDPEVIRRMVEKHFGDIPLQSVPARPDIGEPKQTAEKRLHQTDKLATVPAMAIGYHLPDPSSPDYPAMVLLDLVLQGDDGSRWPRRLVHEKALCSDWSGGINFELGNELDYDGPMLLVARATCAPGHDLAAVLYEVDAVTNAIIDHGVTARELADSKVRIRTNLYDELSTSLGRAQLLAALALFRDDPSSVNKLLAQYEPVTAEQLQSAARKYLVPQNRTSIERVPEHAAAKDSK